MIDLAAKLIQPLLHALEPETAHGASILALRAMPPISMGHEDVRLKMRACGFEFPNPLGMAAGYDKGAEAVDSLFRLGFGFVEVGTITPLPQPGNPRPRIFRLPQDEGVINRLGFNSEGHGPPHARLIARRGRPGILGVNVGANKDSTDRAGDYVKGVKTFADVASYFTINISSPNTPGLRDLQQAPALDDLLARVLEARDEAAQTYGRKPVFLKIAPDLALGDLDDIVRVGAARGIDALILGNTTITRPASLRETAVAQEAGGLSGKPLFNLSTKMLGAAYLRVEARFPIIGAGGIDGPESAFAKIEAGASLIQLYSAMVYKGAGLPGAILRGLAAKLGEENLASVSDAVGRRAKDWAGDFA